MSFYDYYYDMFHYREEPRWNYHHFKKRTKKARKRK